MEFYRSAHWVVHQRGEVPLPFGGSDCVASDNHFFVLGSSPEVFKNKDSSAHIETYTFNAATSKWTAIRTSNPPAPRYVHSAVLLDKIGVLVCGGLDKDQNTVNESYLLSATQDNQSGLQFHWKQVEFQNTQPIATAGLSTTPYPNKNTVIIFGGQQADRTCNNNLYYVVYSGDANNVILSCNLLAPNNSWPSPRTYHTASLCGNLIFIFGGRGQDKLARNDLHIFNIDEYKFIDFKFTGTPPSPRYLHSATVVENRYLWIYGGQDSKSEFLDDSFIFDIETKVWNEVRVNPQILGRARHKAIVLMSSLYLFGGITSEGWINDLLQINLDINDLYATQKMDADDASDFLYAQLREDHHMLQIEFQATKRKNEKLTKEIEVLRNQLIELGVKPAVKKVQFKNNEVFHFETTVGAHSVPRMGLPLGMGKPVGKTIEPVVDNESKGRVREVPANKREQKLSSKCDPTILNEVNDDLIMIRQSRNETAQKKIY